MYDIHLFGEQSFDKLHSVETYPMSNYCIMHIYEWMYLTKSQRCIKNVHDVWTTTCWHHAFVIWIILWLQHILKRGYDFYSKPNIPYIAHIFLNARILRDEMICAYGADAVCRERHSFYDQIKCGARFVARLDDGGQVTKSHLVASGVFHMSASRN